MEKRQVCFLERECRKAGPHRAAAATAARMADVTHTVICCD